MREKRNLILKGIVFLLLIIFPFTIHSALFSSGSVLLDNNHGTPTEAMRSNSPSAIGSNQPASSVSAHVRQTEAYSKSNPAFSVAAKSTAKHPTHTLIPFLGFYPTKGIPVLMYHSINTLPGNTLGVPVKQFAEEMEWLRSHRYHTLTMDEFCEAFLNGAPVPEKPIVITFDDGYIDNYTAALPILQFYGHKATFFIITGMVGKNMMNWEQINGLVRQGNSIGSHTVRHLDLRTLSAVQQESELGNSKYDLENHLGTTIKAFCFPSGRYNGNTLSILSKSGYKVAFTTQPGVVRLKDNPMTLKRVRIPGGIPIEQFQKMFP